MVAIIFQSNIEGRSLAPITQPLQGESPKFFGSAISLGMVEPPWGAALQPDQQPSRINGLKG
jgi:hypothetical protein